jgi:DnaJ like chaperone protein
MNGIWGKIIGAILGFVVSGNTFGALIGMAIGHAYDTRKDFGHGMLWGNKERQAPAFDGKERQAAFTTGVVALSAKMAKVDGRVTRPEVEAFKKVFQIKREQEAMIGRMFDSARLSASGFEPFAFQLAQTFNSTPAILEQVLSGLFTIAIADSEGGMVTPAEAGFLKQVAYIFNFNPEDLKRIAARSGARMPDTDQIKEHVRETADEPLAILGVSAKASNDEIKNAYRTLIRKHHPDKLVAEGMAPEFVANANEKMKRINAAYDTICKIRGIK